MLCMEYRLTTTPGKLWDGPVGRPTRRLHGISPCRSRAPTRRMTCTKRLLASWNCRAKLGTAMHACRKERQLSRRHFIRSTATAISLPLIVPSSVFGVNAPSNKITVGFIGVGGHGVDWNLSKYLKLDAAKVVMVCDVDGYRMRKAKAMVDAKYDNEDCSMTKDFREVLARKDVDAVMISTPDHWHTLISVMAARAGKDVQCEKPTLTIDEGKILIDVIRKHKKVFQTSTEDRSVPEYHRMAELVRNGRIGKLQKIEVILPKQPNVPGDPTPQPVPAELDWDMWLGPAPHAPYTKDRVHFNFRWIQDYSGGIICDLSAKLF